MEEKFWHTAWENNNIGFHLPKVNPSLLKFGEKLLTHSKGKVFLPMCGKTLDLIWFSDRVDHVDGVELSEIAILDFFKENKMTYSVTEEGFFKIFKSKNISLYCGNFFQFPLNELKIDTVYDRASLVALPMSMREKYYQKFNTELQKKSSWLLRVFEYPQEKMDGPPFSVSETEIKSFVKNHFTTELLEDSKTNSFGIDEFRLKNYLLKN